MILDNHVQTKIQSGAGGEEWSINHLGMGLVTPYDIYGNSFPENYHTYSAFDEYINTGSPEFELRGSNTKTIKILKISISLTGSYEDGTAASRILTICRAIPVYPAQAYIVKMKHDSASPPATASFVSTNGDVTDGTIQNKFYAMYSNYTGSLKRTGISFNNPFLDCSIPLYGSPYIVRGATDCIKIRVGATSPSAGTTVLGFTWIEY